MKKLLIPLLAGLAALTLLAGCMHSQSCCTKPATQTPAAATMNSMNTMNTMAAQVPLASFFNNVGITKDGEAFSGGVDNDGYAGSATLLGASQTWDGATFTIAPAGGSNVVTAAGQTIPLPAGTFSTLRLLMMAVNGNQESQDFLVTYANGTVQTNTLSLSDWCNPADYPGESQALSMNYRNQSDGSKNELDCYVFGYAFKLDKTQAVTSVTLPNNSSVKVFAMTLTP